LDLTDAALGVLFYMIATKFKYLVPLAKCFNVRASACILVVTALLKVLALVELPKLWLVRDPLFPFISTGVLLAVVATMEVTLAFVLLFARNLKSAANALLVLCALFALYRLGIFVAGHTGGCLCLGSLVSLTDVFSGFPLNAERASLILLSYLIASGCYAHYSARQNPA
jgi:hypothetical protein